MVDIKKYIQQELIRAISELTQEEIIPEVQFPQDAKFGDFTTNIAMVLAPRIQRSPLEIADILRDKLAGMQYIASINVVPPGFMNFFVSTEYLVEILTSALNDRGFGNSNGLSGKKIAVEFGDPNPFKEIHIGHLRNFCIGECYSRLLESQGADVIRINYQGDVGLHVAKAIWGMKNMSGFEGTVESLGKAYAYGAKAYESDEKAKKEIHTTNVQVYKRDPEILNEWEEGRSLSLSYFEEIYKRIGTRYDAYYFESQTAERGRELVLSHIDDGVFEKDQGAVIYKGEKDGLHTRVFVTRENYATYEGKDLALAVMKEEDLHPEASIILTAHEQADYFQVMLAALRRIYPAVAEKTKHYSFGMVRLKDGKMSSRTGDVITATWLLDEAVGRVVEVFSEMDQDTAEKVGVGAVKYSMLKFGVASDIHFSFDESISLEGNSGPYLLYSYVRTQSVLQKANNRDFSQYTVDFEMEKEESDLVRSLVQYSYTLNQSCNDFAPHLLCTFLYELAQKYNLFYQKHKILGSDRENFRLALTRAVGNVLENGLDILGIQTVDKM